ncbi:FkbM family methyltransferase [Thermoproteota archaeon]
MKAPKSSAALMRIIKEINEKTKVGRIFSRPLLKRTFHEMWGTIYGDVFQGNIHGKKFSFYDPRHGHSSYWIKFLTGRYYEHSILMHMNKIVNNFDTPIFLDIGAHYGYYTVIMSKLGGPSSKVYSFEPNNEFFKILSTNVKLNKLQNVTLHEIALSDRKGIITLEPSEWFRARADKRRMKTMEITSYDQRKYIESISFDDLAEKSEIFPDIVKIDVHGAEGNVITGMKKALKEHIQHLYCELHNDMCDGYTTIDIVKVLQDAGMEIFEFRGFRTEHGELIEVSEDLYSNPHDRMLYARK